MQQTPGTSIQSPALDCRSALLARPADHTHKQGRPLSAAPHNRTLAMCKPQKGKGKGRQFV